MSEEVLALRIAQLEKTCASAGSTIEALSQRINDFEAAEAARERKWLTYGLFTLGGIVSTLVGVIWSYRAAIFKGAE